MSDINRQPELTTTERRILRTKLPDWSLDAPRVCLLQVHEAATANEDVDVKRQALEVALNWDHEDYDEVELGVRPEGADPTADVRVCGIGGCTLRLFQAEDGSDIQTGACKATDYCLKERFEAVGSAATVEAGRALYRDIIDTCDGAANSTSAGHFCPKLHCDLNAGVSIDQVPGTAGVCAISGFVQFEDLDQS